MDYLPQVSRSDVLRVVARDVPLSQQDAVVALLDQYNAAARVQLAVLKLSGGEVERVRAQVGATKDFRDVISPAEYPEFWELGFVGVDKLSPTERQALKARDWQQYQEWLNHTSKAV